MKRFLMLGLMAVSLSGCVSDDPRYGPGYEPYPDVYERRPDVGYRDPYRRPPIYRDDRRAYDGPYREPYRDARRDRRDDERRGDDRRYDDRRYDNRQDDNRRVDRRPADPRRPRGVPVDQAPVEGGPPYARVDSTPPCQQGIFNDCGGRGPQPYSPPVRN